MGALTPVLFEPLEPRIMLSGTIEGSVFTDLNANGIRDPQDNGLPQVVVNLFEVGGQNPTDTVITNAAGDYQFSNVDAGNYFVEFSLPANRQFTAKNAQLNGAFLLTLDSDANTGDGRTDQINLADNTTEQRDAGIIDPRPTVDNVAQMDVLAGEVLNLSTFFNDIDDFTGFQVDIDWGDGFDETFHSGDNEITDPIGPQSGDIFVTTDFSFDDPINGGNNFFDTPQKKDLIQYAASYTASYFDDTLSAITPGGGNSWTAKFDNPNTGAEETFVDLQLAENQVYLVLGGRDLGGSLGLGGPAGFESNIGFFDTILGRGQAGAIDPNPANRTDYALWGGNVTFGSTVNWFFGIDGDDQGGGESDFLSVAFHEMFHVFGFGTSDSFSNLVSGGQFNGPSAKAEYDASPGNPVPLHTDDSHWAEGTTDGGQETALDPNILVGSRKIPTPLDFAGLDDLGWDLLDMTGTPGQINATHQFFQLGQKTVTITVTDPDGNTAQATKQVNVQAAQNTGQISGIKFNDADGDGVQDPGELPVQGVTIELFNRITGQVDDTVVTNANGEYTFTNLGPSIYDVREVIDPGFVQTTSTNLGFDRISVIPNIQPLAGDPQTVLGGDFDGDGDNDMIGVSLLGENAAVPSADETELSLHINRGDGTFGDSRTNDFDGQLQKVAVGDMNGDNIDDLVGVLVFRNPVTGQLTSRELVTLISTGDGDFVLRDSQTLATNENPREVAVGDADNDGDLDVFYLAETANSTGRLLAFSNDGNGYLTQRDNDEIIPTAPIADPLDPLSMAVADIDNDNFLEVVIGGTIFRQLNKNTGFVRIYDNFTPAQNQLVFNSNFNSEQGNSVQHIAIGKTDGDNLPDIVLHERPDSLSGGVIDQSELRLLTNQGGLNFQVGAADRVDFLVDHLVGGNLNGDANLDLVTLDNDGNGVVSVFAGDGNGDFDDPFEHDLNHVGRSLVAVNLDIDGDDDVIVGGPSTATVLVNQPPVRVILTEGQNVSGLLIGNKQLDKSEIHGRKFIDADGDGVFDNGEVGLNGVTVELVNAVTGQVVATQVTHTVGQEDGHYWFENLMHGAYDVRELGAAKHVQTIAADFDFGFAAPTRFDLAELNNGQLAAGDLDGDGDIELIATTQDQVNVTTTIIIGANRGDGTSLGNRSVVINGLIEHLAVADLNGDGIDDLVALLQQIGGGRKVSALISDGAGGFVEQSSVALSGTVVANAMAANDDKVAVVGTDGGNGTAIVLDNDGAGNLSAFKTDNLGAVTPNDVIFADFDNDTDDDILFGGRIAGTPDTGFVRQLRQDSIGTLTLRPQINIDTPVIELAFDDFVTGGLSEFALHLLPDVANATSTLRIADTNGATLGDSPLGFFVIDMQSGDVNGDGVPDLVTIDTEDVGGGVDHGIVTAIINDGSGQVQSQKEVDIAFNTQRLIVTDLDGNGTSDFLLAGIDEAANDAGVLMTILAHDARRVVVSEGAIVNNVDFGNKPIPTGSIHGLKFIDLDGDGTQDANEAGFNGITIELVDRFTGEVIETQVTHNDQGVDGKFWFENAPIGDYFVREQITGGEIITLPPDPATHLYAAAERFDGGQIINELFRINPATGAFTRIGEINASAVTGLAHLNDGRLVGSATINVGVRALIDIDPISGFTSVIGILPLAMRDLAYDSSTDTLYGHGSNDELFVIDANTGAAVSVGATNFTGAGRGLAVDAAGNIFAAPGNQFLQLNPGSGAGALVGNTDADMTAMDFNPLSGVLFAALDPAGLGADSLVTINPATGAATVIGPTVAGIDALAFADNVVGLFEVTVTDGSVTNLDPIGNALLVDVQVNQGFAAVGGPVEFDTQRSELLNFVVNLNRQVQVDLGDVEVIALGLNPGVDPAGPVPLTLNDTTVTPHGDGTFDLTVDLTNHQINDGVFELRLKPTLTDAGGLGLHDSLDFVFRTSQLRGDFDGDGDFDGSQTESATLQHWFMQFAGVPSFVDVTGGGAFNILDFGPYVQNFGTSLNFTNPDGFEGAGAQSASASSSGGGSASQLAQLLSQPIAVKEVQEEQPAVETAAALAAAAALQLTSTTASLASASSLTLTVVDDADGEDESENAIIQTPDSV